MLQGGGVKGIGLVGAYAALVEAGWQPYRVAGTSAGAIVGALIAAGYSPDELHTIMRELDYQKFQQKTVLDHAGGRRAAVAARQRRRLQGRRAA